MNIVFDLDGTLIDSAPDIHRAAARMLMGEGHAPLDVPTIISFIGNGLPKLVERVMRARGIDMAEFDRLSARTLALYNEAPTELSGLYPGVKECLIQLKSSGHSLGLCTNKPEEPARAILRDFGLEDLFDVVIGGDTLPVKKPDPAPLFAAFKALGAGEFLYVGDSEVDAATARAAKVDFALFTEGYRKTPAEALPHAYRFSDFDALAAYVASIAAPA